MRLIHLRTCVAKYRSLCGEGVVRYVGEVAASPFPPGESTCIMGGCYTVCCCARVIVPEISLSPFAVPSALQSVRTIKQTRRRRP
jgi:hypothetical protein